MTLSTINVDSREGYQSLKKLDTRANFRNLLTGLGMACAISAPAWADETAKKEVDVKAMFRNVCGFCHEDSGRHAGKGPQLMDSERTDEFLFNRIKKGMPGRMAAFGSILSDEDIGRFVKFIRNLKPYEEPQNP
jgi:mono/diheme cytochrome c family protein